MESFPPELELEHGTAAAEIVGWLTGVLMGLDAVYVVFSFLNLMVMVLLLLVPFSVDVENRIVDASICSSKSSQLLNLLLLLVLPVLVEVVAAVAAVGAAVTGTDGRMDCC